MFLQILLYRIDLIATFYRGAEPAFHPILKPRDAISVENLTPGFLAHDVIWNISTELLGILDDFCALSELMDSHPGSVIPHQTTHHRYEAELHLLSTHGKHATTSTRFDEPDIQECVRLAAEVYRRCIIYEQQHANDAHDPLSVSDLAEFTAGIARIMQSTNRRHYLELLFWMAFMGSLTVTIATADSSSYWVLMMAGLAEELGIVTWEDARTVMKRFLWSDRRCERIVREFWLLIEQRAVRVKDV